jgi:hypothetical protein
VSWRISRPKPQGGLPTGSPFGYFLFIWAVVLMWSAAAQAYQERLILSLMEGECTLRVEADDQSRTLRLRILPATPECRFSKTSMQTIIKAAFAIVDPQQPGGTYTSLFLGRLVDYPWLSEQLALAAGKDSRWDRRKGRPVTMSLNTYVRDMLSRPEVTGQFEEALGESGYRVTAVTVEKVLVGRRSDVPLHAGTTFSGKAPFDAMVWLILGRKEPGSACGNQCAEGLIRTD